MKTLLRSLVLALLVSGIFSACKKKNSAEEIDLRTPYVGTYDPIQYSANTYIGAVAGTPDQSRGTLTVAKGTNNVKELAITIDFTNSGYKETLLAALDGTKFTVTSKQKDKLNYLNKSVDADYTASGEFTSDNQIIINIVIQTTDSGTLVKKVASYTGPKKQ